MLRAQLQRLHERKQKPRTIDVVLSCSGAHRQSHTQTGLPIIRKKEAYPHAHRADGLDQTAIVEAPDRALIEEAIDLVSLQDRIRNGLIEAQLSIAAPFWSKIEIVQSPSGFCCSMMR